jgi:hypothetical protein
MKRSTIVRTSALGAVCALAGGAAGIAGTSASSSSPPKPPILPGRPLLGLFRAGRLADAAGPPVHSDTVVPNQSGGFDTLTMDRGSFAGLSGDQLTLTEGTKTATYKTVTLTIPSGATIRRNRAKAQLSELKTGDEVIVLQGPKQTTVIAEDAQHELPFKLGLGGHRDRLPLPPTAPPVPGEGPRERP